MRGFSVFPAGAKPAFHLLFNFCKFLGKLKNGELMNSIFKNSSPQGCFRLKKKSY